MARFIGDYNKVAGLHESGTYGEIGVKASEAGSVYWIGQVTDNSVDDNQNYSVERYMGTAKRTFDTIKDGTRDVTGTITYHPHDMRLLFYAMGSIVEVSGATATTATHAVSEVNSNVWQSPFTSGTGTHPAPMSFSLQDSKQSVGTGRNFVRETRGCVVNTATLTLTQGDKAEIAVDYIAQNLVFTTGTTATLVNSGTQALVPYMWDDSVLTLNGSPMDTSKEISIEVNRNMKAPHYVNGSRVIATPYEGNRDYTLSVTMDLDGQDASWLYEQMFRGGSKFNGNLDMNADITAVGSKHTTLTMSGCRILSMDNPSTADVDTTETTVEIQVESMAGSSWDRTSKYNPW